MSDGSSEVTEIIIGSGQPEANELEDMLVTAMMRFMAEMKARGMPQRNIEGLIVGGFMTMTARTMGAVTDPTMRRTLMDTFAMDGAYRMLSLAKHIERRTRDVRPE